jgi:hypothetical protein
VIKQFRLRFPNIMLMVNQERIDWEGIDQVGFLMPR